MITKKVTTSNVTNTSTHQKTEKNWLHTLGKQENLHVIIGVILLVIGLRRLRAWILGLILIILGILFVTGYFHSTRSSKK